MPIQTLKSYPRQGMKVKIHGEDCTIIERMGDEIRVKFNDGTYGFYSAGDAEVSVDDTEMDSRIKSCPFCKSDNVRPVPMDSDNSRIEREMQCMKCSERFTSEKSKFNTKNVLID